MITNQSELNIQDVNAALQIIDAASQRGAFRGEELTSVGAVRDRFASVLRNVQRSEEQTEEMVYLEEESEEDVNEDRERL